MTCLRQFSSRCSPGHADEERGRDWTSVPGEHPSKRRPRPPGAGPFLSPRCAGIATGPEQVKEELGGRGENTPPVPDDEHLPLQGKARDRQGVEVADSTSRCTAWVDRTASPMPRST